MKIFSTEENDFGTERMRELAEGAILGLTVGDAIGVPTEFMEMSALKENPLTDIIEQKKNFGMCMLNLKAYVRSETGVKTRCAALDLCFIRCRHLSGVC